MTRRGRGGRRGTSRARIGNWIGSWIGTWFGARRPAVTAALVAAAVAAGTFAAAVSAADARAQSPAPATRPQGVGPGVRAAVLGDTIRVGDVVPVAVRVTVERGERVAWPDTLPVDPETMENAARVRTRVDTLADGRLEVTGIYAVTPWRTGALSLPDLPVRVVSGTEAVATLTASLPGLDVVSVLPPDTTGIEPRPAKGVLGPSWSLWPFLLALLLLLALVAAIVAWLRRRRRRAPAVPAAPPMAPRERALAALREAREAGLVEQGELKEFYTRVAAAIRHYLAELEEGWSEDLTTSEILGRVRAQLGAAEAGRLAEVLRPADQVKFARRRPGADVAGEEWERARTWVERFAWPPGAEHVGEAA